MKRQWSFFMVLFAAVMLSASVSEAGPYFSGNIGPTWFRNASVFSQDYYLPYTRFNGGINLTGAIGLKNDGYRVETELGYQQNDLRYMNGNVSVISLLANGYIDMFSRFSPYGYRYRPYVTAGVGVARVDGNNVQSDYDVIPYSAHDTVLAYQIGAGFTFPIDEGTKFDLRFRYFATANAPSVLYHDNISGSTVMVGLRYGF